MKKGFLNALLLLLGGGMIGCVGFVYTPGRTIAKIPAGAHEGLSFQVDLAKRWHSWDIGLSTGSTNLGDLFGKHLVARVVNVSDRQLTLNPSVGSAFSKQLNLAPGQSIVAFDAPIKSHPQVANLFGCDTHQDGVSFRLNLELHPPLQIQEPITLRAGARDSK